MASTKILIIDDHPLVRSGLRALIEGEADLSVCCEAASMSEALEELTKITPDFAIIDLSLPDGNGLDLIKRILARHPEVPILVSSMYDESLFAERALRAGAKGYINKQEAGERVIEAIRSILRGNSYLSQRMMERMLQSKAALRQKQSPPAIEQLSNRELEVFEFIGNGLGTREIARRLKLSIKTIETHRANIKKKLGLDSSGELTRRAVQWTLEETH
jgi:DNA-binding NarL/FixJ family response regulator